MNGWLRERYGDPCRECGFSWESPETASAHEIIARSPERFERVVSSRSGTEHIPRLKWSVAAYVAHVADNTRIWAERLATGALGGALRIATYDEALLGRARNYCDLSLTGCLWSLRRSVEDWESVWSLDPTAAVVLDHPEQGPLSSGAVASIVAHEVVHHAGDVEAILGGCAALPGQAADPLNWADPKAKIPPSAATSQ